MTGWRMRPTASALGVIAILFVMITATASGSPLSVVEAESIEHGINHLPSGQDRGDLLEDVARVNDTQKIDEQTPSSYGSHVSNETSNDSTEQSDPRRVPSEPRNVVQETGVSSMVSNPPYVVPVELQRDQSDVRGVSEVHDDPGRPGVHENVLVGSERSTPGYKTPVDRSEDTTYWILQGEPLESTDAPLDPQMIAESKRIEEGETLRTEDKRVNVLNRVENVSTNVSMDKRVEEAVTTLSSLLEGSVTDSRSEKNVDDIRSISFQVPASLDEEELITGHREGKGGVGKSEESRKEHSRPTNNLLHGSKSTKAFYEIKPSIKTEMEKNGGEMQVTTSTQRSMGGRKFVLPSVDSAFGKFGPYFEDGDQEMNITARIGSTVLLDCKIGMLGDKKVTWLQHSKDSFRLLTVGRTPYSVDQRISLNFRYPSNWRLQILYASPRDSGLYKCQVATHPPLVKKINVIVTAPELTITDDSGRIVPKERHLKAGSALKLRCEARDVLESLEESVVWTRGDETLTEGVSENRTTEISAGKEVLVIVSTLIVERASPRHAGNYSCIVPGKAKTTIAVHVLNGELPAAVHDGNGVSRAFLNVWLIHLTMSYVFAR